MPSVALQSGGSRLAPRPLQAARTFGAPWPRGPGRSSRSGRKLSRPEIARQQRERLHLRRRDRIPFQLSAANAVAGQRRRVRRPREGNAERHQADVVPAEVQTSPAAMSRLLFAGGPRDAARVLSTLTRRRIPHKGRTSNTSGPERMPPLNLTIALSLSMQGAAVATSACRPTRQRRPTASCCCFCLKPAVRATTAALILCVQVAPLGPDEPSSGSRRDSSTSCQARPAAGGLTAADGTAGCASANRPAGRRSWS